MFKKIALFSLLVFASSPLHSAADSSLSNAERKALKPVATFYYFKLLQFIQNHVRGTDQVVVQNWKHEETILENISKTELDGIKKYAGIAFFMAKTAENAHHFGKGVGGISQNSPEPGTACAAYVHLIQTTRPEQHQKHTQGFVAQNFHMTLLLMLGVNIKALEQQACVLLATASSMDITPIHISGNSLNLEPETRLEEEEEEELEDDIDPECCLMGSKIVCFCLRSMYSGIIYLKERFYV
ncbi:hypothetical protein K2X40_04800 [Candidatus Babeliales bacterium]|nr:hypothetical protein [Candidatus Babeliales bacterium]